VNTADQVALTLHAMHPQDRLWLIAQLSDAEKTAIGEFVSNSSDSRKKPTRDFDLLIAREESALRPTPDMISRLLTLDASQIAGALEHEPDWLVGIVLDAYHWPWHNAVLEHLGTDRKTRISRASSHITRPSIVDSILHNLYERAYAVAVQSPAPSNSVRTLPRAGIRIPSWLRGLIKWPA
jgi:hypothetical protein